MQDFLNKVDTFFQFLVKCNISVLIILFLVPPCVLAWIPLLLYRTLVVKGLTRVLGNPELCKPLDLGSSVIAIAESPFKVSPILVILSMGVVQGIPDIERIRETIRDRLFRKKDSKGKPFYPELLQTMEYFMGYPFWKRIDGLTEDNASDKYVRVHRRQGGWDSSSLLQFAKVFAKKQFKKGEPLWEIAILEDYITPGSNQPHFVFVSRSHHCMADGAGCLTVLQNLGSNTSVNLDNERIRIPPGYHLHRFLTPIYRGVYDLVSVALNGLVFTTPNTLWQNSNTPAPQITAEGTPEFSAAHSFSLGTQCATVTTVRKVAKTWGVSGTTVILTAVLRSVRNTLMADKVVLPSYLGMVIPLASPLHNGKLTNKATGITPILPIYVENPAAHAREVDKVFQASKTSSLPHMAELGMNLMGVVPHFMVGPVFKLVLGTKRPEYVCLSTLVGPKESPYICGYKAEEVSYMMPLVDGQNFPFFQLLSTVDKLYLCLTADKSLIEDDALAGKIVRGFHDEIASFLEL